MNQEVPYKSNSQGWRSLGAPLLNHILRSRQFAYTLIYKTFPNAPDGSGCVMVAPSSALSLNRGRLCRFVGIRSESSASPDCSANDRWALLTAANWCIISWRLSETVDHEEPDINVPSTLLKYIGTCKRGGLCSTFRQAVFCVSGKQRKKINNK